MVVPFGQEEKPEYCISGYTDTKIPSLYKNVKKSKYETVHICQSDKKNHGKHNSRSFKKLSQFLSKHRLFIIKQIDSSRRSAKYQHKKEN